MPDKAVCYRIQHRSLASAYRRPSLDKSLLPDAYSPECTLWLVKPWNKQLRKAEELDVEVVEVQDKGFRVDT